MRMLLAMWILVMYARIARAAGAWESDAFKAFVARVDQMMDEVDGARLGVPLEHSYHAATARYRATGVEALATEALRSWQRLAKAAIFYGYHGDAALDATAVLNVLGTRELQSNPAVAEAYYRSMLLLGDFKAASSVDAALDASVPRVYVPEQNASSEDGRTVLRPVAVGTFESVALQSLRNGGYIVGHQGCAWTRDATRDISAQSEPARFVEQQAQFISPVTTIPSGIQGRDSPFQIVQDERQWPEISSWNMPTFVFIRDGAVVASFSSWPGPESLERFADGMRQVVGSTGGRSNAAPARTIRRTRTHRYRCNRGFHCSRLPFPTPRKSSPMKKTLPRHPTNARMRLACATSLILALVACSGADVRESPVAGEVRQARNVIVLINDGAGWGTWDAAAYWQYGARDGAPYAEFPARYGMTTHPLHVGKHPTGGPFSAAGYEPARAWETTPTDDEALPFEGYRYLATAPTDSAAAGTALSSGVKTYLGAINYDNNGQPLEPAALFAKAAGKAAGVVTSVPFAHATPAAFGAQNRSRKNYHEIARQMLSEGHLDLIMGTGAPGYNVNGTPCERLARAESRSGCDQPDEYLAAEDWDRLRTGGYVSGDGRTPWRVIRDKAAFAALASGSLEVEGPILGVPEIAKTLQQQREEAVLGRDPGTPSGVAHVDSVPTLDTMARGALRHLANRSTNGFFLMIEGGATDWAGHTSHCGSQWSYGACGPEPEYGRLIEETVDFNNAVASVVEWVETHSSWDETLVIVTTDHDNSMPMGPDAQAVAFQPIENRGKGRMPGLSFRPTGEHSNALVPLWAKGAGAEYFARRVRGRDEGYAHYVGLNDGRYVDNTDVAIVVRAALLGCEVEEPAE